MRYLIGIDEAGRGPLAGPVAVGAVMVPRGFDWKLVTGAKDSKQMTPAAREVLYAKMVSLRKAGRLNFAVAFSSAPLIDERGIVLAIQRALNRALQKVTENRSLYNCEVRLDGSLKAPAEFVHQSTIIRGDMSEPIISLASIAAKVERDRLMVRMAKRYPQYRFEAHKGYGTRDHRARILQQGFCPLHRTTFCKALLNGSNAV